MAYMYVVELAVSESVETGDSQEPACKEVAEGQVPGEAGHDASVEAHLFSGVFAFTAHFVVLVAEAVF